MFSLESKCPTDMKEPVRFDSFRFRTFLRLIGSVRFGSEKYSSRFDAVRPAFFGRVVARSGSVSVRFGSSLRPVPAGSGINSSVRFGSAGSLRFLFPSCLQTPRAFLGAPHRLPNGVG